MAYKVNQYRYNKNEDYLSWSRKSSFTIDKNKIKLDSKLDVNGKYYLKIFVESLEVAEPDNETLTVKLIDQRNKARVQYINDYPVSALPTNNFCFEFVVTPDSDYSTIVLQIGSESYDTQAIVIDSEKTFIVPIKNVIDDFTVDSIIKMGIQGPPGLLICINGQGIRIGPSGMYEIKEENYNIVFIGFAIEKHKENVYDGRNYFILDYQYEQEG